MLVYNYNPTTFEYTSYEEAGKNPINPDEPIIPAFSTTIEPLEPKEKFAIIWIGNKWTYREDHRGEDWFDMSKMSKVTIDFIGEIDPKIYCTLDSPIANKPEGDYWVFDSDKNKWVGDGLLYKKYINDNFGIFWATKLNTPFELKGYYYLPDWRDLYTSIYVSLNSGIKTEYRLQDAKKQIKIVDVESMKEIMAKMSDVVDEMYLDKHNLEEYFITENNFDKLQDKFTKWLNKEYKTK